MSDQWLLFCWFAGCGGSSNSGGLYGSSSAAGSSKVVRAVNVMTITETEFSISYVSKKSLKAGNYTFNVSNSGALSHNLTVKGPGS